MQKTQLKNRLRNRIVAIVAAVVIVVVALVLFVNANTQRIVDQNSQYLESSSSQTVRRVNDVFQTSLESVETAAQVYERALDGGMVDPRDAVTVLDSSQFDQTFFIDADGMAYNRDGRTASVLGREYYERGIRGESDIAYVDNPVFSTENVVVFYAPVRSNGQIVGVMASIFYQESLTELMDTEFYGTPTPAFLVKPDGRVVAHAATQNNEDYIDQVFSARLENIDLQTLNADIASGDTASFTYRTTDGTGNSFIMKLPDFDWVIVRSFPASITNEMVSRANLAGYLLVAGALVAAVIVILLLMIQSRKESEELLLERQEATRIIDTSTNLFNSLFTVDLTRGTYEFLKNNDRQRSMLPPRGTTADLQRYFDQVVDRSTTITDGRPSVSESQATLKSILRPDVPFVQEEWCTSDRNDQRWYQASLLCLERDQSEDPTSILIAIQDVTDAKAAELASRQALEEAFRAAEHASQAKSDFLNSMSHDIRTPMNSIMGLTAIAGMHVNEPERVRECLANITSASRHLLGLINEVLDMAKIESGTIGLTEEEFDLPESIESLITILSPQINAKHQDLKVELVDIKHEHVIGDPTRLQQVFVNIMGNAIKFTPEGGKIGLRITELPSKIEDSGCYEFVFTDTGVGMSKEFMKTVFDPFTRVNDSRTSKIEGTGLGMAIVKSVVTLMSGTIDVDSIEGEGTTFTVIVHLKLRDGVEEDISDLHDVRALVVDDDAVACEGACMLLGDIGMRPNYVRSGQAGIEEVAGALQAGDPYRVVILDWRMPEMSGLEAAKQIREVTHGDVPIIILSAYDWSMIEQEARQVGVDAFISKPLFRSRLIQVMKELITGEKKTIIDEKEMLENLTYSDKRVLLTEDNLMASEIAKELIGMTGASVEHAENGQLAVDMLLAHEPDYYDIVLMDIQMPVMNGYEAASTIRGHADQRPDMGQIPIVALTADAFAEDIHRALSAGMNDHMSKPLEIEMLVSMLQKWMR